jgi:hypothetical protein
MSSTLEHGANDLDRAERLKRELLEFATRGPLRNDYQLHQDLFVKTSAPLDEQETESVLDWFVFDWLDHKGEGVIEHFLTHRSSELSEKDVEILLDWANSINSVFEIRGLGRESLKLRELDSKDEFHVTILAIDPKPFKRGEFIISRLLPLGEDFIFSGLQFVMPDRKAAEAWLEMREALDSIDSPEAVEKAQREQCTAFCELFGCDELTVNSRDLNSTLLKFQQYLLRERRDPETGKTTAERFKAELGEELMVPEMQTLPEQLTTSGEVTILCDEFDGIVLLPDYQQFKAIFETNKPDEVVPNWKEIVWHYIKDPDIPIVAFERIAERSPARVEKVMRSILGDRSFSLEHLYAVLLHFKQPADGFEELEDEVELWDLFNGNAKSTPRKKPAAERKSGTRQKRAASSRHAAKTRAAKSSATANRAKHSKPQQAKKSVNRSATKAISAKGRARTSAPSAKKKAVASRTASAKSGSKSRSTPRKASPPAGARAATGKRTAKRR